jgi:uncharacterized protein YndB with AHSA1/START domain
MEARDGSYGFDFTGTYEEVTEPHLVSLRLDDGRLSRTTFDEVGGGTLVTTTFDPDQETPIEMQQQGWQAILDNYGIYVTETSRS